jgi:hypothetical protein
MNPDLGVFYRWFSRAPQKFNNLRIHLHWPLKMQEMPSFWENDFFQSCGKEPTHACKRFQPARAVFRAMQRQRRDWRVSW